jgi:hypothetical protein
MITPVEALFEAMFSTVTMYLSLLVVIVMSVACYLLSRRTGLPIRQLSVMVLFTAAFFAAPNIANALYPFRVVDRNLSCLRSSEPGRVPPGVLHHPTAREIAIIEER